MADTMEDECLFLPPGFRFHPTDEEIITNYLYEKVADKRFSAIAMGEVDLNSCEPWDLPAKAKMGEKVWYFLFQKERKYPTGMRTNRTTAAGYWKATGKDKEIICKGKRQQLIGMKKTLVFYMGRAPKGEKTNWVMHEFRLEGYLLPRQASKDEWVVCRVFHKDGGVKMNPTLIDPLQMIINGRPNFNPIRLDQNQYVSLPQIRLPNSGTTGQYCKVEPVSNSSTGNGNDPNYSSDAPFLDLENMWDY